jgi:alpha-tubulin suppressor-like RCC1 family protein
MTRQAAVWTREVQTFVAGVCFLLALAMTASPVQAQPTPLTWGDNEFGQLGEGTTTPYRVTPEHVLASGGSLFTKVIAITNGGDHTVVLRDDSTVWAWGANSWGQLGDGTTTNRSTPAPVKGPGGVEVLTGVTMVAAGNGHTVALKADGTVWTWGFHLLGQLGDGTFTDHDTPRQVVGPNGTGFLTDIVSIAAGGERTVALQANGTVWTWGRNIGPTPVQVKGTLSNSVLTDVVMIAAGEKESMALKTDGTVWTWVGTIASQMGGPEGNGYLTGVVAIAAGFDHLVALKANGSVWTWGMNTYGQLGNGFLGFDFPRSDHPIQVPLGGIVAIAAGFAYCLALEANGTVWGWGGNAQGQLGRESTHIDYPYPIQAENLNNAVAIAAGERHSAALQASAARQTGVTLDNIRYLNSPIRFEFRPVNGGTPQVRTVIAGPAGVFSFQIPQGTYNVAVKGSKWLQQVLPNVHTSGGNSVLNLRINLTISGDANNDNSIDVLDLALLIEAFEADPTAPNWDTNADFNGDESVDVLDIDILIRNFDLQGDP